MWWRFKRQFIALMIFFAIIGLAVFGAYKKFIPASTCFDNRKNQNEVDVDCGGPNCISCTLLKVQNIQIISKTFIEARPGSYDAVAFIQNPNYYYRSPQVEYEFELLDANQATIALRSGNTFINQDEQFRIVEPDIRTSIKAASVLFRITKVSWEKHLVGAKYIDPVTPDVALTGRQYSIEKNNLGQNQSIVRTGIYNNTPRMVSRAYVSIFLLDTNKNIVGTDKKIVENLESGENRPLTFTWPQEIKTPVDSIVGEVRINSFAE